MNRLSENKLREAWIDYIKGISMIVIILNHISLNPFYGQYTYSWELSGFFFVGGYTFSLYGKFKDFFLKKFKSLVIPVFAFGLLNLLLSCLAKDISIIRRLEGIFLQFPGQNDDMWFVACLFVMELMFYLLVRFVKNDETRICLCVLLLCCGWLWKDNVGIPLPWHLVNACMMLIFVECGYLAKKYRAYHRLRDSMDNIVGTVLVIGVVGCYILFAGFLNNYPVDIHLLKYGDTLSFYILAFTGTCALIMFCVLMESVRASIFCRSIGFVGRNSLAYYGLQSKMITIVVVLGLHFGFSSSNLIVPPAYTLIVLIILAPLSYFINRFMPFMLGRAYKKK